MTNIYTIYILLYICSYWPRQPLVSSVQINDKPVLHWESYHRFLQDSLIIYIFLLLCLSLFFLFLFFYFLLTFSISIFFMLPLSRALSLSLSLSLSHSLLFSGQFLCINSTVFDLVFHFHISVSLTLSIFLFLLFCGIVLLTHDKLSKLDCGGNLTTMFCLQSLQDRGVH